MAERRMFAKSVVESARFLKMPVSTQNLYFHLGMNADDDGVVEAYSVINLVKANEDDLKVLHGKDFVRILNEDLVTYLVDWREQNKIRPDRKKDSIYRNLLVQIVPEADLLERKERSDLVRKPGPSMDGKLTAQCSAVEESAGKESIGEYSVLPAGTHGTHKYQLDHEYITDDDYRALTGRFPQAVVDSVIGRILAKRYHGCLNVAKISAWCSEHVNKAVNSQAQAPESSRHSLQLSKLARERVSEQYG